MLSFVFLLFFYKRILSLYIINVVSKDAIHTNLIFMDFTEHPTQVWVLDNVRIYVISVECTNLNDELYAYNNISCIKMNPNTFL